MIRRFYHSLGPWVDRPGDNFKGFTRTLMVAIMWIIILVSPIFLVGFLATVIGAWIWIIVIGLILSFWFIWGAVP